ncbi:fused response regulator/phosphatase [Dasania sp. GY-MA-18]|uniref:Fused response regulator/phosphatase n=1 Tax=Dasania phycosphaerae TaxID=2950436 RepID=A0A9J6RPF5_9GAMM|nr:MULTISPECIES: fused response regulator/phosphatase [Dasania]MCR8923962.1 fused response regulator/phosphatase [Dasania sp. GY-MA-18]MCZ0866396.1 fused response regulator/phosphatase [Dasania phycosphaerae]MCZ0870120.1 fused response regulator/phosphatase [Dasania phycosphaerae]
MDILIVDDSHSITVLLECIIEDLGHQAIIAKSGELALEHLQNAKQLPDLVLLDVKMTGIDGYETAKQLKQLAGEAHLPIIFLTGSTEANTQNKCLSLGEDYISKPFSVEIVTLKIKAQLRVAQLTQKMHETNLELLRRDKNTQNEHRVVESIFTNQFKKQINHPHLKYHMSPVSVFNGDVLLAANGPADNTYLLIGDATGHGLAAAVGVIPIYSAFRTMASKGLTVGTIAAELNKSLLQILPDHMMLAAAVLEINTHTNQLFVWSGGIPNLIIDNGQGRIKTIIPAFHPPLAATSEAEFLQNIEIYELVENDRIYLFTDGIEEANNQEGEMFGEQRLLDLFDGASEDLFEKILSALKNFTRNTCQDDDITLVEFSYHGLANQEPVKPPRADHMALLPWKLELQLTADTLRHSDPIPPIIRFIESADGVSAHQDFIATILTELYSNALEHGLLQLDSNIKDDSSGFIEYYQQRLTRLAELEQGYINISLECLPQPQNSQLKITVSDSGQGYNLAMRNRLKEQDSHGRGLMLIKKLCHSLDISEDGKTVIALYDI